jgi:hypothetical protein
MDIRICSVCERQKGQSNHWFRVRVLQDVRTDEKMFICRTLLPTDPDGGAVCGEACAAIQQSLFMQGTPLREATKQLKR